MKDQKKMIKKIGLLKRLQNTEDKNEKQSNVMKDQREN